MGLLKILFSLIYFILGALGGAFSWLTWGAALANLIATYRKDYQKRRDNLIAANTEALRKDPKLLRECLGNLPAALLHPEFETAEWLNQAVSKLWTNLDEAISLKVKSIIEYHLPSWLGIEEFTFGKKPFVIKGVKYVPVDKGQARDSGQPEQDRAVVLDLEVEWQSDCSVVLNMNFLGQSVSFQAARLQDVEVSVPLRIELKPLVTTLPCFSSLQESTGVITEMTEEIFEEIVQTVRRHTQMWNNEFVFLVDNKRTAALKMCIESSPDDIMYSYRRRIAEEDFELFELDLRGAPKEGGGELVKGEVVMRCTYYDITSGSDSLSKRVMVDSGTLPVMIVAGTSSRVGTTSLAVGLMAALHKKGLIVQTANAIFALFTRSKASSCTCVIFFDEKGADVVVIEGASGGLHDGRFMDGGRGSTAEVASWLQAPVLLVVEAVVAGRGAAAAPKWGSAVAAVKGNAELDSAVQILGTVANRVPAASPGSDVDVAAGLRVGLMTSKCDIAVFGALPQDSNVARAFPTDEIPQAAGCLAKHVQTLGQLTFQYIDIDELLKTDGGVVEFPQQQTAQGLVDAKTLTGVEGDPVRVAVAWDDAFSRYYHSNLALLEARGIHLEYFSPLAGERLPHGVSGLYLGSGHVERHAAQLSAHRSLRDAVQELLRAGGVVYAEGSGLAFCGTLFQQGREYVSYVNADENDLCTTVTLISITLDPEYFLYINVCTYYNYDNQYYAWTRNTFCTLTYIPQFQQAALRVDKE
eukprot:gene2476-3216_t